MKSKVKMKIEKHAKSGDLRRLKHYIKKYNLNLNAQLSHCQTVLHFVCKNNQDHMLRYLLRKGADVGLQDKFGNIPLHYALNLVISGEKYAYQDLVKPLLGPSGHFLDLPNNQGVTPRHLLDQIVTSTVDETHQTAAEESASSDGEDDEERCWNEKLSNELEQEYSDTWGKYETDYLYEAKDEMESHEDWSERINHEYRRKHEPKIDQTKNKGRNSKDNTVISDEARAEFQRKLEQEHQEYLRRAEIAKQEKLKLLKREYENKWESLLENRTDNFKVCYSDIPWPPDLCDASAIENFLLCDINRDDQEEVKKYLRQQQVRWHPDKFMQKFGNNLEVDKDDILKGVKNISQVINNMYDKLLSSGD